MSLFYCQIDFQLEVLARPIPSYSEILKSPSRAYVNGLKYKKVINPLILWDFVSDNVKKIFKPTQKNVHINPEKKRNFLGVFEKDFPLIDSNTKREKGKPPVGKNKDVCSQEQESKGVQIAQKS